ncbi:hypothetical protein LCGC14_0359180 [marine sediment metagenome]|uniref:Uncharacterized protein n=1 Tax=marine sediment metagenome TaxID=412755 RepID=A0A0F9WGL4_9ZZZZ|nr:hypothetical protein [Candidatus Aminicenantes bacterium]
MKITKLEIFREITREIGENYVVEHPYTLIGNILSRSITVDDLEFDIDKLPFKLNNVFGTFDITEELKAEGWKLRVKK